MNLRILGTILSVIIITSMITLTVVTNFGANNEDPFAEYSSGLIEDQSTAVMVTVSWNPIEELK